MTVTWTSGYGIDEAQPFVEWGPNGGEQTRSPAGTLTISRSSMCGLCYSYDICVMFSSFDLFKIDNI